MRFPPCALLGCVCGQCLSSCLSNSPSTALHPCRVRHVCTSRAAGSVPSHCTAGRGSLLISALMGFCTLLMRLIQHHQRLRAPMQGNGQLPLNVLAGARIKACYSRIVGPDFCISFCFTCSPLLCTFGVGCCFPRSHSWHAGGTDLAAPLTASCCAFMGIRKVSSADMLSWALS